MAKTILTQFAKRLLPCAIRRRLRRLFDHLFCCHFDDKETLASAHSPWTILKRHLDEESIVYSGGVGHDINLDLELIERFGLSVYVFDPSPVAVSTIQNLQRANSLPNRLCFNTVGLAGSEETRFSVGGGDGAETWFKKARGPAGETLQRTTILREMKKNRHDHIDLLKLDIEGFEDEVVASCLEVHIKIRQICVEFHHLCDDVSIVQTVGAICKLHYHGFRMIHKHMCDFTFYNTRYLSQGATEVD